MTESLTSRLEQIARAHGFVLHSGTSALKDHNPAATLELGETDADLVNSFCAELNHHYSSEMLFAGRPKPSPQSLKKELWADGDKAQATIVPKPKQLTILHPELTQITEGVETFSDSWTELAMKGYKITEGELLILESLQRVGLPQDTFRRLVKLREEIKLWVKDGTWEKLYSYWRQH